MRESHGFAIFGGAALAETHSQLPLDKNQAKGAYSWESWIFSG